jgi:hypothetical protein
LVIVPVTKAVTCGVVPADPPDGVGELPVPVGVEPVAAGASGDAPVAVPPAAVIGDCPAPVPIVGPSVPPQAAPSDDPMTRATMLHLEVTVFIAQAP